MKQAERNLSPGFTLLEVLIVFAVLGLLASLAAFGLPALQDRTEVLTAAARLGELVDIARTSARRTGDVAMLSIAPRRLRLADRADDHERRHHAAEARL